MEEASGECRFGEEDKFQVTDMAEKADTSLGVVGSPRPLDLNTEVFIDKSSAFGNLDFANNSQKVTARGIDLDLNVEDVSSSANLEMDHPFKNRNELKSRDASECASSTGDKDPLRVWKEMKQNGFLSSTHGGIPAPKQRGRRRSKSDALKKKMEIAKREKKLELAKKEQIDRFSKLAAPCGLLTELNPGIINHVRNRKQVHSIIEAIVKSEKQENERLGKKHPTENRTGTKAISKNVLGSSKGCGPSTNIFPSKQTRGCSSSLTRIRTSLITEAEALDSTLITLDRVTGKNYASHSNTKNNNDTLAHNLPENACPASNDEAENSTCISSLSFKAATVASQWLELIHQDIKGRLSALRRSKKRVRAVISTELPFLISKEFSSNEENNPYVGNSLSDGTSSISSADMHQLRWSKLFDQMDKALSEEEKQLESWLNQVKEMQLHCDQGLTFVQSSVTFGSQHLEETENNLRTRKMNGSDRDLAVGAAAASIYSTCKFLLSENASCF